MSPAETMATPDADQSAVIAFLRDPASHPGTDRVDMIETHGNLIFLAGDVAWKIKRAVAFPYMDFSTLALRRRACEQELAVNARFSPDLYLGCRAICRSPSGVLAFDGPGEPVEWAVEMRRFDQRDLLGAMATRGGVTPAVARAVADAVFASHASAPVVAAAGAARIVGVMDGVVTTLRGLAGLDRQRVAVLASALAAQLAVARPILDQRGRDGRVRHCHGDLHCDNIVVEDGRVRLYDAIEFDPELATVDTLYDLAFLLMDLDRRGQRAAANAVLNRYLWRDRSGADLAGLRALPLFLALRASIRALVTAERAEQEGNAAAKLDDAATFLARAIDYAHPAAPRLVAIGGLSGTGKSTLGAALAPQLGAAPGAVHLRSDLERKAMFGLVDETQRLPPEAYAPDVGDRVYAALLAKARTTLAAGASVVLDAVSMREHERHDIAALAAASGVPFTGLWLSAPPDVLRARVSARRADASDATAQVVDQQLSRSVGPLTGWATLDASGTPAATAAAAAALLDLTGSASNATAFRP